jgi:hypothetical protein
VTFEEFQEKVKRRTRTQMRYVDDPKGDIIPGLWHYFEGEKVRFMPTPEMMQGHSMETLRGIQAATKMFAMHGSQPTYLAMQFTGWVNYTDGRELTSRDRQMMRRNYFPEGRTPPSLDPTREEWVWMHCMSKDEHVAWGSQVTRNAIGPPTFGEWKASAAAGGRFFDVLRNTMVR